MALRALLCSTYFFISGENSKPLFFGHKREMKWGEKKKCGQWRYIDNNDGRREILECIGDAGMCVEWVSEKQSQKPFPKGKWEIYGTHFSRINCNSLCGLRKHGTFSRLNYTRKKNNNEKQNEKRKRAKSQHYRLHSWSFFGATGPSSQQAIVAATAAATVRSLWAIRHARNTTSKLIFNLKMIHKMVRAFRKAFSGRPAQVAAGCEEQ